MTEMVRCPVRDPRPSPTTNLNPERYIGYFRRLADLRPGPDGMPVPSENLAVMSRYGTEPFRT